MDNHSSSYFSTKTYVVTPHLNHLDETVLMMGHNIRFKGVIWKIICKYSFDPFLSGTLNVVLCSVETELALLLDP